MFDNCCIAAEFVGLGRKIGVLLHGRVLTLPCDYGRVFPVWPKSRPMFEALVHNFEGNEENTKKEAHVEQIRSTRCCNMLG